MGKNGHVSSTPKTNPSAYLRPANLALVFAGGTLGVLARELLILAFDTASGLPVQSMPAAVFVANISGALLLGVLLGVLASVANRGTSTSPSNNHSNSTNHSPSTDPSPSPNPSPRAESMRLLLGTGVLGGFTTYSALAQIVASYSLAGDAALAMVYGVGTVVAAAVAAWFGMIIGGMVAGTGCVVGGQEVRRD